MTRVACYGTGGIADRHLTAMAAIGGVEFVGICGRSAERAAVLARKFGAPSFDNHEVMLDRAKPEALLICVTPNAHGAIERAAIERKIPILVEKPLSDGWPLAAELAAEIERARLITSVGYQFRHLSTVDRLREILSGRKVGMALGYWLTVTPAPAWWSDRATSGGQTIEQATHIFDMARYLVGEIDTVYGISARVARGEGALRGSVDEVATASVKFAGGAVGSFASTHLLAASYRVGLHLFADGLAMELSPAALVVDDGKSKTEYRPEGDATLRQDRAFLEAVRTGDTRGIRSTYADALRTHRVATRVVESAACGLALPVGA